MNETGHMVVDRIAWDTMTAATRKKVAELVADSNNPQSGVETSDKDNDQFTAGTYMDDIRPKLSKFHFDNQRIDEKGNDLGTDGEGENSVSFFNDNVAILKDSSKDQDDRAEALRYIMHLTGDLHQPLHNVDRVTSDHPKGDRGGNQFPIEWHSHFLELMSAGVRGDNLHAYWDDAAGEFSFIARPLTHAGQQKLDRLAAKIEQADPQSAFKPEEINDLNPQDWARDGRQIAISDCYQGIQEGDAPSDEYKQKCITDMNREAALGGYRLGTLLNHIFDPQ